MNVAAKPDSFGICAFCEQPVAKRLATRHVASCPKRPTGPASALHLVIEGGATREYWLHVLASPDQTFADLDDLLRATWLECCGHLSAFKVGADRFEWDNDGWGKPPREMTTPLADVLVKGVKFVHDYDFGSTTRLTGRSAGTVEGVPAASELRVVAQNQPPAIACEKCGAPAAWVASYQPLCKKCGKKVDEYDRLPVVNSPRMGVCGYTG